MIFWDRTSLPVLIEGRLALSDRCESAIMNAPDASRARASCSHCMSLQESGVGEVGGKRLGG